MVFIKEAEARATLAERGGGGKVPLCWLLLIGRPTRWL
jgi:hypothetical protein